VDKKNHGKHKKDMGNLVGINSLWRTMRLGGQGMVRVDNTPRKN
jgi:hypothetical protein